MNVLYNLIETERIGLNYADLLKNSGNRLYGAYLSDDKGHAIILDRMLYRPENRKMHRSILGEELGHYFTAPRCGILQVFGSHTFGVEKSLPEYYIKVQMEKDENLALKWATDLLMPDEEYTRAIREGCASIFDLAEWFDVTEWFVYRKLGFIKLRYRDRGIRLRATDYFSIDLKWQIAKEQQEEVAKNGG